MKWEPELPAATHIMPPIQKRILNAATLRNAVASRSRLDYFVFYGRIGSRLPSGMARSPLSANLAYFQTVSALWDDVRTSCMAAAGVQSPLYATVLQLAA